MYFVTYYFYSGLLMMLLKHHFCLYNIYNCQSHSIFTK